jgi:hypothetical protein
MLPRRSIRKRRDACEREWEASERARVADRVRRVTGKSEQWRAEMWGTARSLAPVVLRKDRRIRDA